MIFVTEWCGLVVLLWSRLHLESQWQLSLEAIHLKAFTEKIYLKAYLGYCGGRK